ncbi:molybdate ABC transporter substrate-binding protein [Egibacter rhizosphaerae]|uniref:molybdate ABC transporter substrate-binding protein n=1 Tax=Egibacter rhizosphaerae TaxID=1670831 RepID=UPI0013F163B3|nr:molybdate ABC transporter substrate-binding protein [Egibacter rhizosphaerae]
MIACAIDRSRPRARRPRRAVTLAAVALVATAAAATACSEVAGGTVADEEDALLVGAAADLRPAIDELVELFENESGEEVTVTLGSSGHLAQQIREGAPIDVYASAHVRYVEEVVEAGRADPSTQATYAYGRLALWAPDGREWTRLGALAADPDVRTVAIANPAHAPYGQAAEQALRAAGAWERLEDRLAFGSNIADAHQIAASGNADAAVTALSLALADDDETAGWTLVDDERHEPLEQSLVVTAEDPDRAERARAFANAMTSEHGRRILRQHGFQPPGEGPPPAWEE